MAKLTRAHGVLATLKGGICIRKVYDLVCEYCKSSFKSTHNESRFCSRHCANKARYINNVDKNVFQDGWNSINAYFFGLIMSDGCITHNKNRNMIVLGLNDKEMIEYLHSYVECKRNIYKQDKSYRLYYWNEEAVGFMRKYNLTEKKSLTIDFPDLFPEEYMPDFIRGIFDGDGSVTFKETKYNIYPQVSITMGSLIFLQKLKDVLENYNIESHIYEEKSRKERDFYLKISKINEVKKFKKFIYYNNNVVKLERKFEKLKILDTISTKYNMLPT